MKKLILFLIIIATFNVGCKKESIVDSDVIQPGVWVSQDPFLQLSIKDSNEKNDVVQQYKEDGIKRLKLNIGSETWIYTIKIINKDFLVLVDAKDKENKEIILRKMR